MAENTAPHLHDNVGPHPWRRYVALGDSFTEGVGDPEESAPNGLRGWADRVAEVLGGSVDDFAYANLAVRGKLIRQIMDEQIGVATEVARNPTLRVVPPLLGVWPLDRSLVRNSWERAGVSEQVCE